MAKVPKKQPSGLEWAYTAMPGTSEFTKDRWFLDGPDIDDTVTSGSKADIEMIAAALNFSANFEKFKKRSNDLAEMLTQMSEFK